MVCRTGIAKFFGCEEIQDVFQKIKVVRRERRFTGHGRYFLSK